MSEISKLKISDTTYDLKDQQARIKLNNLAAVASSGKYTDLTVKPSYRVGGITVVDNSSDANASVTYSNNQVIFNFAIPKGERGQNFCINSYGDSLSDRNIYNEQLKGFTFIDLSDGKIYYKLSDQNANWSEGFSFSSPTLKIQYSADNLNWHSDNGSLSSNDIYIRFSVDGQKTWSSGRRFFAPYMKYQYGSTNSSIDSNWHNVYNEYSDYYIRFSNDNGKTWSQAIRFVNPVLKYQYSHDNIEWYQQTQFDFSLNKQIYMKFSTNNGLTWSQSVKMAVPYIMYKYSLTNSDDEDEWYDQEDVIFTGQEITVSSSSQSSLSSQSSESSQSSLSSQSFESSQSSLNSDSSDSSQSSQLSSSSDVQYLSSSSSSREKLLISSNQYVYMKMSTDGGKTWSNSFHIMTPHIRYQYSSDNNSWSSTFVNGNKYMRFSTDGGYTWTQGYQFVCYDIQIQYSADNSEWHTNLSNADIYIRFSTNGGQSWTNSQRFTGYNIQYKYCSTNSDTDSDWHDTYVSTDKYIKFSNDDGSTWTEGQKFAGQNVIYKYSETNSDDDDDWHDTFSSYDVYIKFSNDGGLTWTDPIKFVGSVGALQEIKEITFSSSEQNNSSGQESSSIAEYNVDINPAQVLSLSIPDNSQLNINAIGRSGYHGYSSIKINAGYNSIIGGNIIIKNNIQSNKINIVQLQYWGTDVYMYVTDVFNK